MANFVRTLELNSNNSFSRLARSTKLSKTDSHFRLSGALSVQANPPLGRIRLSSKPFKISDSAGLLSIGAVHRISTETPASGARLQASATSAFGCS